MFTYEEFINNVDELIDEHPEWRKGQAMFNTLYLMDGRMAESIRATVMDPFYSDEDIEVFLEWLLHELGYEDCPYCDNTGAFGIDKDGEAIETQCEFCWTNPRSIFYQKNRLWEKESA